MQRIRELSEEIVSQISAGEVIERPSYAVKELIENSIDAGADSIYIDIEDAGLSSITVSDNGEGMVKEDLLICIEPHTTSKLSSVDQLTNITSLGFRGEALSSIAAISHLTIKSRYSDELSGTKVIVENGTIRDVATIGFAKGTSITVEHLFSSMPVRKKFLKSIKTEFRHIVDVVTNVALSYPSIHFTLIHNQKTIFDLPVSADITERVKYLLGDTLFDQLLPFEYEEGYIKIHGYIGKPQSALKHNQKQFVFINGRTVTDRMISLASREAYGTLLPQSGTPVFILLLELPYELVDVNIHPRKSQVSFRNAKTVFDSVKQTITQALQEHNLTFRMAKFKFENSAKLSESETFSGKLLKKNVVGSEKKTLGSVISKKSTVTQLAQTYIVCETEEGLVFTDQHAAHERILYEDFVKTFEKQKRVGLPHSLQSPLTVTLSFSDSQIYDEYKHVFHSLGFDIEHLLGTGLIIRSYPHVFVGRNIQKIIMDMLSDLAETGSVSDIDRKTQRMISFLSCRAAVKAGDPLTQKQMKTLLKDLETVRNNTTCPHGRPTQISFPLGEVHKWFHRK